MNPVSASGPRARRRGRAAAPRGAAYVMVLSVSLIVAVLCLSALLLTRLGSSAASTTTDWQRARLLASSALEHALLEITAAIEAGGAASVDWRSGYTDGETAADVALGGGRFDWHLTDATGDGILTDDPLEPLLLVARGHAGGACYTLSLGLESGPDLDRGLGCLESGLHASAIALEGGVLFSDHRVSSNGDVVAAAAEVHAAVEAVGPITGGTFHGPTAPAQPARSMPADSLFAPYLERGTPIDVTALPTFGSSVRYLTRVVLSPASNPFGPVNPQGIYVIDCAHQEIHVHWSRIVGTLVLIDPGPGSTVDRQINWEPASPDAPALLVRGNMAFEFTNDALDERNAGEGQVANFNPPGTPRRGRTDEGAIKKGETFNPTVHDDLYPSVIAGLVYVSGNVEVRDHQPTFEGVLVAGGTFTLRHPAHLRLVYRDLRARPPQGFCQPTGGPMEVVVGSARRVVSAAAE
jgi:hypothetical protein